MDECFRCGISGDKVRLYDAISKEGIVKVCNDCASIEEVPIIKKPTESQITESVSQRQVSVRDRLKNMSNQSGGTEVTLREIIDRNFKNKKIQPPSDMIDNFHWIIQRIRRSKKISREQFAKDIGETEESIKMLEQGFLPGNNYKIINKIENYFGINLRRPGTSGFPETPEMPKKFGLDDSTVRQLKISDVQEMTKKHEEKIFNGAIDSWEDEWDENEQIENDFEDSVMDDELPF